MRGELHGFFRKMGVSSLVLTLFFGIPLIFGIAEAQESMLSHSHGYERPEAQQEMPASVEQQQNYHDSGTVGRMGLGASPFHPEGPGNFSHR